MKELITDVQFKKERQTKFGTLYDFVIKYNGKQAFYSSKSEDQKKFIPGEEAEFTEEEKTYTDKNGNQVPYWVIKPFNPNKQSNYGRALNKEKARYSGFAVAYAKDLVVAGRLDRNELSEYSTFLFNLMVELDKSLDQ